MGAFNGHQQKTLHFCLGGPFKIKTLPQKPLKDSGFGPFLAINLLPFPKHEFAFAGLSSLFKADTAAMRSRGRATLGLKKDPGSE